MRSVVPILMYHSVDGRCAPAYRRWTVSPERFAEHMSALRDHGRVPVTVTEMVQKMREGRLAENAIAITFDDGLADFKHGALPVLQRFGFASTLFVATGYVGGTGRWLADLGEGDRPMLSWDELKSLTQHNVEIGAHTHTHPQLDLLPLNRARSEIELSKALLEDHLEQPVRSFAYPHGYSTPAVRQLVAEAGFESACRVADGLMRSDETPYALSRLIVTEDWSAARMGDVLQGKGVTVGRVPDRMSTLAWRLYRRFRSVLAGREPGIVPGAPDVG